MNQSDSELMAGLLKKADFTIVDNPDDAFIIIINTCSVKGQTENHILKYLNELKELKHKKIIITGCLPQTVPEKLKGYPMLGTQPQKIVELVEEVLNDNPIEILKKELHPRLNLPKVRKNPVVEIIPICEGCLGDPCSYCIVKKARGELVSYPKEEIINQIKEAVKDKIPEIWLTAQDTGCYGKDINSNLIELLIDIIQMPGDFKIRLGMINPNHVLEFTDELIEIFKSKKIFKFLHIPVQSGNNDILKAMKRKYTVEEFKEIIQKFKSAIPEITIATDVIVGFPGETEEQFFDSVHLIREIKPAVLNISRFWPRPGTEAEKLENQIHGKETKRRSQLITDIFHNIARMENERWINWEGNVLIDEHGKDNTMVGRNICYKPVIVTTPQKLGDKVKVKIKKITPFDLRT